MKTIILAGGKGTRLSEYTKVIPKPMVEIGGKPILWHIMKIYSAYGFNDFIIALGYKGEIIKDYFVNYWYHNNDMEMHLKSGNFFTLKSKNELPDWIIQLIDTGLETQTGGRLKRLSSQIDKTFMLTYGDGVSNINIDELVEFHKSHGKLATLTAIYPPARYGNLEVDESGFITEFQEKSYSGLVNGGFYVLEPEVLNFLKQDDEKFEVDVLPILAETGELKAYIHTGFWQCMDTIRDVEYLNTEWENSAPWKVWDD